MKKVLHILYLIVLVLILIASFYSVIEFPSENIEQYLYYGINGISESDSSILLHAIKNCIIPFILLVIIIIALFYNILGNKNISIKNNKQIYPINIIYNHRKISTIVLTIIVLLIALHNIGFYDYIYNNIVSSNFLEKNYTYANKDSITFDKKNNVVIIYVESLETSFISEYNGGLWEHDIVPELYDLYNREDAVYFSSNNKIKGIENLYGTGWTTASVISSSIGLPFKVPINNLLFTKDKFLNGAYTLGDVLKDNGYHNEVISGAPTYFGGLNNFFKKHGDYEIIDIDTLDKYGFKMTDKDVGSWGFNDHYMFEIAKERILELAESGEPFNETLIGIDTHPMDGYKSSYTINKFDTQYENVYATEAQYISDFILWLSKQDFYNDMTVVIMGDHLCMQYSFMGKYDLNERGRYNLILNSEVKTDNIKNRSFTSIDMYPTILAAMGANIKNNRIGLGTNLFSNQETITEQYGLNYVNQELKKRSTYYNNNILK